MTSQTTAAEDLLQPGHIVKERWKVVCIKATFRCICVLTAVLTLDFFTDQKNWRGRVWRNLRRNRPCDQRICCSQIGVCQAAQKGSSTKPI